MIELKNLTVEYQDKKAVDNVTLTINSGELTVLAAPNGGGKSTLLKAVAGLQEISGGEIVIDGKNTGLMTRNELTRKVSYLSQSRNTPSILAKRMVLHGRFPYLSYPRKYRREDYEAAQRAMEQTDSVSLADCFVPELSGGQRQRVYLAMTLAQETDIILMDEPLNFLDVKHQMELMELSKQLASQGKTVISVIHDIRLAMQEADRIAVLNEGRLEAFGTPEEICSAGSINKVFGIELDFADTDAGRRYYYK